MSEIYESPLSGRYASRELLGLFSAKNRHVIWRRLWTELARAQQQLGLPVTAAQVAELEVHQQDIDYDLIAAKEREIRHDVMAHIYGYGQAAPGARGIIHLGATSCYVTDNADLILFRDACLFIRKEIWAVVENLSRFAETYQALPTLGYTHFQPAQLVTVGKRACLWIQDLLADVRELDYVLSEIQFLGCRGTTGTEASFIELFDGDSAKIDEMNRRIAAAFGFQKTFPVCGQTYPRKLDSLILNALSSICQSAYKFGNDLRLLQHLRQIEEPHEAEQVGSSAMAYKRNPMRSERLCSLARFVMVNALNAPLTASTQWFERTLDDSANRRITLPEGFLATDAVLRLMRNITAGLVVNEKVIARAVEQYLPFVATENLLMASVEKGGDRQVSHEIIRGHSLTVADRMKDGEPCDLLERLAADEHFNLDADEMTNVLNPADYIGRSPEQVKQFLASFTIPADIQLTEDRITL